MKASYQIDDKQISDMQMTISITMTVSEWRDIMRTKSEEAHYKPFSKVKSMISHALGDLTNATEKVYKLDQFGNKEKD